MGQRHNRRRTRPRSRNRSITLPSSTSVIPGQSPAACDSLDSISIPTAPTWHLGYTAWGARESALQLEAAQLEDEQCRLFGGEPGDDVALCYRMLEYFGGLDYIDSWVTHIPNASHNQKANIFLTFQDHVH
ncbi:hypothetical protein FE257_001361 [Aspergillus nanangensis]|uniref:Uncharacterized protein n=1 Tax=Aspergillus nanangensis TaxID=2582783 RepID=A0AAD4GQS2_ASPNN|nr:hypothetical protein FE257_001361 [Aspergillus nanangensis]